MMGSSSKLFLDMLLQHLLVAGFAGAAVALAFLAHILDHSNLVVLLVKTRNHASEASCNAGWQWWLAYVKVQR